MDWNLVLEFTKALAGPIATVAVALIALKAALTTFLRQKAIERRLEWFGRLHRELDAFLESLTNVRSLIEVNRPDIVGEMLKQVMAQSGQLRFTCDEGIIYATSVEFDRVEQLRNAVMAFHHAQIVQGVNLQAVQALLDTGGTIFKFLAMRLRAELGLPPRTSDTAPPQHA